jgi:hypothetical protein
MRNEKNYIVAFLAGLFLASCATVGAVIDGGVDLGSAMVDSTVKTAGKVTASALSDVSDVVGTVAEASQGVVDQVVENIDKQTDELQKKEEEK